MSKKFILSLSLITALLILGIGYISQQTNVHGGTMKNPKFSGYVSAFTSGYISNESAIRVVLTNTPEKPGAPGDEIENIFEFSPSIDGVSTWIDSRTIEFRPSERLPSGTHFDVEFHLSKLFDILDDELEVFEFSFKTIPQSFEVIPGVSITTDTKTLKWQQLRGVLSTSDKAEHASIEKVLIAKQDGKKLHVSWNHLSGTNHEFVVDSIQRKEKEGIVTLTWNGESIESNIVGEEEITIPALGDFKVTNVVVVQSPEQYISVQFSDPIKDDQNLNGLITIDDRSTLRYIINGNEIKAYPAIRQSGEKTVSVNEGIKNVLSLPLPGSYNQTVRFEELKPEIKLLGNGVILPNSNGLILPFEAVSLKAVDIKITKIYENNIVQFLQVNNLDGQRELYRVGKQVLTKKVNLTAKSEYDMGRWNTYSIDLSELIATEPGAIYRVSLSMKKEYASYYCEGEDEAQTELTSIDSEVDATEEYEEYSDYEYYGDYDDYYYDDYDDYYKNRNNPCSKHYYNSGRIVSKNVIASDLGLMAKYSDNGKLYVFATDLITTKPLAGVEVKVYDFQQQVLKTFTTDADGKAFAELEHQPFLLAAKYGTQNGFLKIDRGTSLSLSTFDVSGSHIQKGLKGFIYGERGVWRPGDTLFLSFILEDKDKTLPNNHPVTMELYNPRGQLVEKQVKVNGVNGFYDFTTKTESNAPTGNYTAKVRVGGATFSKTLKVETIMPNRLRLNLDFGAEKLYSYSQPKGTLKVEWLHGAIAKGLKSKVEVNLSSTTTEFENYKDFTFYDPAASYQSGNQLIFDGRLNEEGKVKIEPTIEVNGNAPGFLKANFTVRTFEEGGAFSIDRFSLPYSPYERYVGIKVPEGERGRHTLYTDTNHVIDVVTVDEKGNPVSSNNLEVKVYKVGWRWWWAGEDNNLAHYISDKYYKPVVKKTLSTTNGKGSFDLRIDRPEWGRYLVRITDPASGHSTGKVVYIDWPYWAGSSPKGKETASLLSFNTDKEKYEVGEEVTVKIPSSAGGHALVSLESGSKVIQTYWVETQQKETSFSFMATEEMAPNIYVNVSLLQPHAQAENDLPIRMYGVMPVKIENPRSHVKPVITCAEVWRPEEVATLSINEEEGKEMSYTIAVVDEGLLDLTRFATPSPWNYFYAREALGVRTWDIFDMVMGSYSAALERILAIGGDGEAGEKGSKKANRFKPMVKFLGPFHLDKGEKQTHKIMMPQYVGSVRVMAIAGYDMAYGSSEKRVAVRKPLMLLATLPRVVGPGETIELPVNVFAMEKKVKDVTVKVSTNEMFSIERESSKNIRFNQVGDEVIGFKLKVNNKLGIGKVKVVASGAGEKSVHEIEIDVRNPNPRITKIRELTVDAGNSWDDTFDLIGMQGTNKVTLEISSLPPMNLEKRLNYLIRYPHGCVEQTTSSVFPQVYLSDLLELDENEVERIDNNIKAGISRLKNFQTGDGGFGYWPGNSSADDWSSSYAGNFLLEAKAKGYDVPKNMLSRWKRYQKKEASRWSPSKKKNGSYYYHNSDLTQAYRLYTLALAGSPEMGAMNRLKETKNLSIAAKWRLAAAYGLAGQKEIAKSIVNNLPSKIENYREMSYTYGSSERDEAMILETMDLLDMKTAAAGSLKRIAEALGSSYWYSTQTTAYCLVSVAKFIRKNKMGQGIAFSYSYNGNSPISAHSQKSLARIKLKAGQLTGNKINVKNTGGGLLYGRVTLEGIPLTGDNSQEENDLKLDIKYTDLKGNSIDPTKLDQGSDFVAMVTVKNPGYKGEYKEMALSQIFPSGWEIRNTRLEIGNSGIKSSRADYQNFRDDRVYTYFNLNKYETKVFRVVLNASYVGRYYLPTVSCEAMYDNSINAHKSGKWVEVVKPRVL